MEYIKTLNAEETALRLRELGMKASPAKIRNGIRDGAYPFGDYIMVDKQPSVTIYAALLEEWISRRLWREGAAQEEKPAGEPA